MAMRRTFRFSGVKPVLRWFLVAALSLAMPVAAGAQSAAPSSALEDLLGAVVGIKTFINPDAGSVRNLGREREGTGIIIDESGLVLTIGYLMVEAHAAQIVTS